MMLAHPHKHSQSGFTLIEMSIVLIIIGLVVGGIIVGEELIYQSRLRKTLTDVNTIMAASNTFMMKYEYMPGDFPSATSFFPTAAANGDGNGVIDGSPSAWVEGLSAWNHMTLAKLYPGKYTGYAWLPTVGTHVPAGAFTNSIYAYWGSLTAMYSWDTQWGGLFAQDAFALDSKADDGLPNTGKIVSNNWENNAAPGTGCKNGNAYVTSYTVQGCLFIVKIQ